MCDMHDPFTFYGATTFIITTPSISDLTVTLSISIKHRYAECLGALFILYK